MFVKSAVTERLMQARVVGTTAGFANEQIFSFHHQNIQTTQHSSITAHHRRKMQDHVLLRSRNSSTMATGPNDVFLKFFLKWLVNSSS